MARFASDFFIDRRLVRSVLAALSADAESRCLKL